MKNIKSNIRPENINRTNGNSKIIIIDSEGMTQGTSKSGKDSVSSGMVGHKNRSSGDFFTQISGS